MATTADTLPLKGHEAHDAARGALIEDGAGNRGDRIMDKTRITRAGDEERRRCNERIQNPEAGAASAQEPCA